jgi:hypothetical protein
MKKISLLFACAIFSTAIFAQTDAKFGIKGGLNIANINVEGDNETDSRLAPHVGLLAHIHLAPQWALQPELMYSGQGLEDGDVTWKLNYINIPVNVQYMFDNGFRLQTGPQVGFLASSEIDPGDLDLDDDLKKTDFSWTFGLGYLSYSGFGVDARYNLGLTDINESGGNKLTNRVFQLGVFYMFDKSHKAKSR